MRENIKVLKTPSLQTGLMTSVWLIVILLFLFLFAGFVFNDEISALYERPAVLRVGILYSQTGTMAVSEKPLVDAALLAIEEINAAGGVLGRKIRPVIADGESDLDVISNETHRLIHEEDVDVLFACWTSACRKTIKPIVESSNSLLFYVVQYEGMETSPNIIYLGSTPNQQIIPSFSWLIERGYQKFFLVGSDYIFPRVANHIIADMAQSLDTEIVGEEYLPLGTTEVEQVTEKILASGADFIINTINGSTNIVFYQSLRQSGVKTSELPSLSFSVSENMIDAIGRSNMAGEFLSADYFQSIDSESNHKFITAFHQKFGKHRSVSNAMESVYIGIHLWGRAFGKAKSTDAHLISRHLKQLSVNAPQGIVSIDRKNMHAFKTPRIAKMDQKGRLNIVRRHGLPVNPQPYPVMHTKFEWDQIVGEYYANWGNRWVAPAMASP